MSNIQRIKYLRPILTEDTTQTFVLGLVISHIDYCNSLFAGLPEALRQLHWLPIQQRIKHKLLTIVFKCLNDKAPAYLKNLLVPNKNRRGLRSEKESRG